MFVPHRKHTPPLPVNSEKTMKKREKWVVVRDTTGGGNRITDLSSVLKVPRHCPFVLLVSISF
jgi:hypothetical protein